MALSLSNFLYSVTGLAVLANAATVTYDFNATWLYANPVNQGRRAVMGFNGQWPIPPIVANVGDRVVVNLYNGLGNESTSLHFHGLYQNGTTIMDGAVGVTQCAVPPGGKFTYNFTIDQPGTYWYHSHIRGQYPDGMRGPLIVHDTDSPYKSQYDEEIVLTLSDWYNDMMPALISSFLSYKNPTGAEPVPNAAMMNDTQNLPIKVQPGKTYLFRIINMGAFAAQYLWIEGHQMQIVEVDGIYTQSAAADMIYVAVAQRYSVLVTTKNDTSANFAIVGSMDQDLFDKVPPTLNPNVTGWLVYDDSKDKPAAKLLDEFKPYDDFNLVPYDQQGILDKVDHSITLNMKMDNLGDGANYAFINDVSYVAPKVPTLFTALTTGLNATNAQIYGDNTNAVVLAKDEVVELILNNNDPGKHPFHLHGHAFQVVLRSDDDEGDFQANNHSDYAKTPMRRDTLLVRPNGYFIIRFKADNPGTWLFHCHIEWHVISGLMATFIEAPLALQQSLQIPQDHQKVCQDTKTPMAGNAAGNTKDLLDLNGENKTPAPLPAGFTARGIVALVFSCVAAVVGMAVIAWYGAKPITGAKAA